MKQILSLLIIMAAPLLARDFQCGDHPYCVSAPDTWNQVTLDETPSSIQLLLRGEGAFEVPPTLNVAVEQLADGMTLEQYMECVKGLYGSNALATYTKLGPLPGGREPMELVQVQMKTNWGTMEMLQGIAVRDGKAFVITASARTEEFGDQLPIFIRALQSFSNPKGHQVAAHNKS